jgi:hypothetical protein
MSKIILVDIRDYLRPTIGKNLKDIRNYKIHLKIKKFFLYKLSPDVEKPSTTEKFFKKF